MIRQILAAVFVTGLVIAGLGYFKYRQISQAMAEGADRQPPPVAVTSIVVAEEEWPQTLSAVGTLEAVQGTMLSAEAGGRVASVGFESGSSVEAGQVLVELDSEVERAQLEGAKAQLQLAELTAKRQRALRKKQANSQSDLDTALAELRNARAEVARLNATIERRKIIAPFAGTAGIVQVDLGETVSAGTPIVALQAFDSLHVDFSLPQQNVASLAVGARVELSVDAFADKVFVGRLTAIDSAVDATTRNLNLQATLDNPGGVLRPGMFAGIKVVLPDVDRVLTIPSSSISYAPYGNTVFVIAGADNDSPAMPRAIRPATVKLGRKLGDRVAVLSGLEAGEEVVSAGTFRLRPDVMVIVNNAVQPGNEQYPNPSDT